MNSKNKKAIMTTEAAYEIPVPEAIPSITSVPKKVAIMITTDDALRKDFFSSFVNLSF
jgi:hypothetical protein